MTQTLFLRFPDRATACVIAAALIGADTVESLHADGWWTDPAQEHAQPVYWCLDDIGAVEGIAGYHINGLWHSSDPVPAALETFRVFPETPWRVFG